MSFDILLAHNPLFLLTFGFFTGLFFHHIVLYSNTGYKEHLFCALYGFFLFWTITSLEEQNIFFGNEPALSETMESIAIQGFYTGLILFTAYAMDIKSLSPRLYKHALSAAMALLFGTIVFAFTDVDTLLIALFASFSLLLSFYLIYYASKCEHPDVKLYLWAFFPFTFFILFHSAALFGMVAHLAFFKEAISISAMWNMLLLSFMFSNGVKKRQAETAVISLKNESEESILFLQSRYASMGETIGNIAHQWKQPLNAIGALQTGLKATLLYQDEIPKEKLIRSIDTSFKIIKHLAETIDTFYGFLSSKQSQGKRFKISDELESIRKMTEYSFNNSNISLHFDMQADPEIEGNSNEFMHVLLNLILNAKDAFVHNEAKKPEIVVQVSDSDEHCCITVSDNAGGIRIEPIDLIFQLHVSSKEDGSGLGLYMAKKIIEKRFGGTISVENRNGGAAFSIILPYQEIHHEPQLLHERQESHSLAYVQQLTRKVIELEELEKTFKKWADTFWQVEWGLVIYNATDGTIELMNPAFARIHGYRRNELTGKPLHIICAPECRKDWETHVSAVLKDGHHSFESINLRKDGTRIPVTFDVSEIKDESGECRYLIANIRDITEQKEADELLKLKRFALNHIKDEVFLIDENGRFHYVNCAAIEELGYSKEAFLTMYVKDINPEYPAKKWPPLWNTIKTTKHHIVQSMHRRKDGSQFPVEVSGNYFEYNGQGYILAIGRNISERLIAEQKKSNERMRLFFERQLVGMAFATPEKEWLQVNKKLEEMLGYTFEELQGRTWAELTHPDDLSANIELSKKMHKGEIDHYALEKRYIRRDGSILHANVSVGCVRKEDGTVDYVLAIIEDISDRKAAEETIKLLNHALKRSMESLFIIDSDSFQIVQVNDRAAETLGYTKDELTGGMHIYDIDPHHDTEDLQSYIEILKHEKAHALETCHRSKSGRIYPVKVRSSFFEYNGKAYVLSLSTDITERKLMEDKLRKSEEMFRTLVENADDNIIRYDTNARTLYLNPRLESLLGVSLKQIQGKTPSEHRPDGVFDEYEMVIKRVLRTGETETYELTLPNEKGDVMHHTIKIVAERDADEKITGAVAIGRDITERKKMEESLRKNRIFLAEAQRLSHTGSWELDLQTYALKWSDEIYCIFEIDKKNFDASYEAFLEAVHPDDRNIVDHTFSESLDNRTPYEIEHRLLMPDGRVKYVYERGETRYAEDGKPQYTLGTIQDITELKRMENSIPNLDNTLKQKNDNTSTRSKKKKQ